MCTVCGCGTSHDGHDHDQARDHTHGDEDIPDVGALDFGSGRAGVHIAGLSQERTIRIERGILAKNDALAGINRRRLRAGGIFALNMMSSPGSGKTSLLVRAILDLKGRRHLAVIEGDQQTSRDAERIRIAGAPVIQLNTGNGCHLDAHMVGHALDELRPVRGSVLFIENVGNLVCPAGFDLGEASRVVVLSVTEGEDKPLKYPNMFAAADLLLLNKIDLLPHLEFDMAECLAAVRRVNPTMDILPVSARSGAGLATFYDWIDSRASS